MKYTRLTKEQFSELSTEFINFLATQTITAIEWEEIKTNKPEVAEQELDVFSDLIWEGALSQVKYLENTSKDHLSLFHLDVTEMHLLHIKVNNTNVDLLTSESIEWLLQNLSNETVEIFKGSKKYSEDKNLDKFGLIQQGAVITKGELYKKIKNLID